MKARKVGSLGILLTTLMLLQACAGTPSVVSAPGVSLRNVEIESVGFSGQSFLLGFDVSNPNPFPLPVKSVAYGVELEGYRFASGSAPGDFTIPARGDGTFTVSVEVDLLKTAPQLLHIVRQGVTQDLDYELNGELGLNIPYAKPVRFRKSGEIRMAAEDVTARR